MPQARSHPEAGARFLREARAAARIQSEHVARVFDVGQLATGEAYLTMEYLEGSDVAALLASEGRLDPGQAVDYLLQACEALAEAHALGIVHRDLKPANLFLVRRVDGRRFVKVLDFGISKMTSPLGESDGARTGTAALLGSPLYMSPEQMIMTRAVDARSDIWALGVVLYEMLTGSTPFVAETLPQVCALVMSAQATPIQSHRPELPSGLAACVMRCLEKDPARRYENVAALSWALRAFGGTSAGESAERISQVLGSVPPPDPVAQPLQRPEPAGSGTSAVWSETMRPAGRSRVRLVLALGGALLVVAAGVSVWLFLGATPADLATAPGVAPPESAGPRSAAPPPSDSPEEKLSPESTPDTSSSAVADTEPLSTASSAPSKARGRPVHQKRSGESGDAQEDAPAPAPAGSFGAPGKRPRQ